MRAFYRTLRILSAITLFFFCWTYMPIYAAVAWAATPTKNRRGDAGTGRESNGSRRLQPVKESRTEERFEKAVEDIREKAGRAEDKAGRGISFAEEIEAIKSKKAEIESLDTDLQKQFAATEKKLKDAKLPKEILDRHYKFVKHYNDHLNQLKAEIGDVEKAAGDKAAATKAFVALKDHLEKTKPPRKHVPLDPNNLPNRLVKAKAPRKPRLKKEDFEKDFPQQKQKAVKAAFSTGGHGWPLAENDWYAVAAGFSPRKQPTELTLPMLAFNSNIASDMPLQLAAASTTDLPSADDLAETPEIQFTQDIQNLAAQLNYSPLKIYEWVRNNIDYQPYYGSFKGAAQTLTEGAGNDFDQASLLIALLRVSNIHAKYAYGTVEIPIDKVMNWLGGVTDPQSAGMILATQGIPATLIKTGSIYKAVQLEHVWVDAWIDYIPSRGAVHKQGNTWIPLDSSFKQFTYKQGMDLYALMGFNADDFLMSYITDTHDITAYQDYSLRMINFLDANYPDASVEDVLGASDINTTTTVVKQEFPYLLGTLPYKVIVKAFQFSQIPPNKNYTITFQIESDSLDGTTGLSYTSGLNDLASKRVTVSYDPATSIDEALIAQYGDNIFSVPPYLLTVKPILRISGAIIAIGGAIGMGKDQTMVINFAGPDGDADRIQNIITAGAYSAIILQSLDTPIDTPGQNMALLIENSKRVETPDITIDDLLGQMLYSVGVSYFHNLTFENELYAKTLQLVISRQPSEAMVTYGVKVNYIFGLPQSLTDGDINIDVDRNINSVYSLGNDKEREKAFMFLSGLSSSVWENRILETFFDVPSVSAVRLLKLASEQEIPIYTITSANLNDILPQLDVGTDVITDIRNAVNAGRNVLISKTNLTYNEWSGVGYITIDPSTGAAGYMISGGLAGGNGSRRPQNSWSTRYDFVNAMLSPVQRRLVIDYAITKLWTTYDFGCVDGGLDCSGLTYKAYRFVGIRDFPRGARYQYGYVSQRYGFTDKPLFGDLVFFHGTYDANKDGVVDERDISHVGIYVNSTSYIAAQRSKGSNFYLFDEVSPNGAWAAEHFDSYGIVIP